MDRKFYTNDIGSESREATKIQTTANIAATIFTCRIKRKALVNIFLRIGAFVTCKG